MRFSLHFPLPLALVIDLLRGAAEEAFGDDMITQVALR